MRAYLTLVRRELGSFFTLWTGYTIIAAVVFLLGLSFSSLLDVLNAEPTPVPVTQVFYLSFYFWLIVMLVVPLITMRSFALEKSSGTYETLMTTPVGDGQVVLAKFTGALLFYMVLWLPLTACVLIVRYYSNDPSAFDPVSLGTTYVGLFLLGCVQISMGIFASALTRSQIIAAMISAAIEVALFMAHYMTQSDGPQVTLVARVASYLRWTDHMNDFAQGVVDSRPVVISLTFTVLFLFLTWKVVQSRRWR